MTRTAGSDSWLRAVGVAQIAPVRVAAAAANPLHLRFPTRVTQITPLAWRERCYLSRVARRAVRGGGGGASGRRVASATTCVRPSALLLLLLLLSRALRLIITTIITINRRRREGLRGVRPKGGGGPIGAPARVDADHASDSDRRLG